MALKRLVFLKGQHLCLFCHMHKLLLLDKILQCCAVYNCIVLCKFSRLVPKFCLDSYNKKSQLGKHLDSHQTGNKAGQMAGFLSELFYLLELRIFFF